ncbi:minor tail protein [Arthrobacter phage CapnMurica]|uniref:Minor tail protein n=2 Tax=Gordonvirus captnmurica TaxID=1982153 RepID=A0A386KS10_9CAUD|nr:minor tail protein [Arthrobacter phage CaptnMurica]ALY08628.1 minor tail protein [Arthrobacter phage CaptnMurica]AYD87241.1 minor tail protein [Arthrobacter phage Tenno]
MEVYILDDFLRRKSVIDLFESCIWTDRFAAKGDVEIVVPSIDKYRRLLVPGTQLALNESDRIMTIETADTKTDSEGRTLLTASGVSLESMLEDRIATDGVSPTTENGKWVIRGTPGNVVRQLFDLICRQGMLHPGDVIPFIQPGTLYPEGSLGEISQVFDFEIPLGTLYQTVKDICDMYDLGFRLVRDGDKSKLFFEVYSGDDRTTQQSELSPVLFSPELDNLQNVSEMASISGSKNVAYVFSKTASRIVYAADAGQDTAGFDRRVLHVNATDIDATDPVVIQALLLQKGQEALAGHRPLSAIDGEINQYSKYKYGRDYGLGDLVEMRNTSGATNHMRITEQIFVSDAQGDRSYPTLTMNRFITNGTWDSWGNTTWDGGGEEVWDE